MTVEPVSEKRTDQDRYEQFVQLAIEHEPSVRASLRSLLPTWHDVDEVIQEATLVAWRKFDSFTPGTSFGGWLMTIARFEALRYRRKMVRSPLVFADDVWELIEREVESVEDASTQLSHLESCLSKLDPKHRELLLAAHTPGRTIRQIAAESGRSEQALYKAVQRWRHSLLNCLSRAIALEGS